MYIVHIGKEGIITSNYSHHQTLIAMLRHNAQNKIKLQLSIIRLI